MRPALVARPSRGVIIWCTAFTVLAWGILAGMLWPIYRDVALVILAAVAIPLAVGMAIAAAWLRWPAWGTALAGFAAFVVIGVPLAVPARTVYGVLPEPQGIVDLLVGVVVGWRQLLSIDVPVGSYQALLVPALVLLFVGPLLTLSIALRARRGELAVIVPLATLPLIIALGPEQSALPISTAISFAIVVLLWLAVWRRHRRRLAVGEAAAGDSRWASARALVTALALVLVAGGIGAAAVSIGNPVESRTVLRSIIEVPFDPLAQPSPLAGYRAAFDPEVADQAAIIVRGPAEGVRLRLAVLDSYDGVVFAVGSDRVDGASGTFVRVPTVRDLPASQGETVELEITLARASGVWLPTAGDLAEFTVLGEDAADVRDSFVYNATTSAGALVGGVPAGLEYRMAAIVDSGALTSYRSLAPGDAAVPGIDVMPEALGEWLATTIAGVEGAGAQLDAVLAALRDEAYLSHGVDPDEPPSRSGHSVDRLNALVTERPMVGDAEQYAAAVALMARELGFPSRVVLGYGPLDAPNSVGEHAVLTRELTAWVEISTASEGWVAVDVVPAEREIPPAEPEEPNPVSRPQNAAPPPVEEPPPAEELAPPEVEQTDDNRVDPFWAALLAVLGVVGWIALALGLAASPLLIIAALKRRRRRRRRTAAEPAARIIGGWLEVTDAALDHGLTLPPGGTRTEIARAVDRPQALVLARVADRAVYAPEEPTEAEADRVWQAADVVRASFGEGRTLRDRVSAALSTASLRGYSQRNRTTTGGRRS